jgi:hypothetical protein
MHKRLIHTLAMILFFVIPNPASAQDRYLHEWNSTISEAMVMDGFSPMLSSRTFAYPNIAAYEILVFSNPNYLSLQKQLNGLAKLPIPDPKKTYNWNLAAIQAFDKVAEQLIYRRELCVNLFEKQLKEMQIDKSSEIYINSVDLGSKMADAILAWAKKDRYAETKAKPRYIISNAPEAWQPTPPEYKSALEPFWGTLRPFALKEGDIDMFNCHFKIPFSTDSSSLFYKNVYAVYDQSKKLSAEQTLIAKFWDDNPDQNIFNGHFPTPRRQMNPVSHWVGIAKIVSTEKKQSMIESSRTYVLLSIAIADGFICCFEEKYKSNLIRPVTYIKNYIDQNWDPLLVTPPFPEHTSGHSVISAASSNILTHLFGDHFSYVDSSEIAYGYTPRKFDSFYAAAQEAGISRFYGGIHYMTAIDEGAKQGMEISKFIISNIRTNKK